MKVGVIADVHGDVQSFLLALDLLHSKGVEIIVCAGDLVSSGPESEAVVRFMRSSSMQCICGNHDREAIENGSFEEQTLAYLRQLPATLNFTWENRRVALAHGAPWSDLVYLYPTSERHVFKRVAREACAEIVILGHTHVPLVAQVGDTWVCNPGSVCEQEFESSQTCGVLTVPDFSFDVYRIASQERVEMRPVHITR